MRGWRAGVWGAGVVVVGACGVGLGGVPTIDTYTAPPLSEYSRFPAALTMSDAYALTRGIRGTPQRPDVAVFRWEPDPLFGLVWVMEDSLEPEFGYAVLSDGESAGRHGLGLSGEVAAVGHSGEDISPSDQGTFDSGAVFIFERGLAEDGSPAWSHTQTLVPEDLSSDDHFGFDVALDGLTLAASAPESDAVGVNSGRVYVYARDDAGGEWSLDATPTGSLEVEGERFGNTCDLSGNRLIASSHGVAPAVASAVLGYIFEKQDGAWIEAAVLQTPGLGSVEGERYVGIEGDVAAVCTGGGSSVWLFERDESTGLWAHAQTLEGPASAACRSIDMNAGSLVVGLDDDEGAGDACVLYRRTRSGEWVLKDTIVSPAAIEGDTDFGGSVGVSAVGALVGAPTFSAPLPNTGRLYSRAFTPDCDQDGEADPLTYADAAPDVPALLNQGSWTVWWLIPTEEAYRMTLNRITVTEGRTTLSQVSVVFPPELPVGAPFDCLVYRDAGSGEGSMPLTLERRVSVVRTHNDARRPEWIDIPDLSVAPGEGLAIGVLIPDPGTTDTWVPDGVLTQIASPPIAPSYKAVSTMNIFNPQMNPALLSPSANQAWRIVALFDSGADCNENGVPDECDIASGWSLDLDLDGLPDECLTDCNENGIRDTEDISSGHASDCNGNGVPDSCEIGAGDVEDCDDDGIPDSCSTQPADYALTDLLAETVLPFSFNNFDLLTINQFAVEPGMATIIGARIAWGREIPAGHPAQVALLSDPDQDGHPADAEVIASVSYTSAGVTVANELVDLPPTVVGEAGTSFFVALLTNQKSYQKPVGLDTDAPQPGRSFYTGTPVISGGGSLVPSENIFPLNTVNTGNFTLHAVAANPADLDADGVPDVCQAPPACAPDVTGDGVVDTLDLNTVLVAFGLMTDEGDTNGDGVVDSIDLNAVLVAFGSVCE